MMIPAILAQQSGFGPGAAKEVTQLPQTHLEELLLQLINVALILSAVVALGFIVYGGFRYIISRGNERDVETAKSILIYAVLGLVVIGVAAAIVNFVVGAVIDGGGGVGSGAGGGGRGFP